MTRKPEDGRARQAKGSVLEAIGKIIGDPAVETRGQRENEAGARQAARQAEGDDAPAKRPPDPPIDRNGKD